MQFTYMAASSDSQQSPQLFLQTSKYMLTPIVLENVYNASGESSCAVHCLLVFCFFLSLINFFLVWRMAQKARAQIHKVGKVSKAPNTKFTRHQHIFATAIDNLRPGFVSAFDDVKRYSDFDNDLEKGNFVNPSNLNKGQSVNGVDLPRHLPQRPPENISINCVKEPVFDGNVDWWAEAPLFEDLLAPIHDVEQKKQAEVFDWSYMTGCWSVVRHVMYI
ncbi:hypothetical protein PMIN07_004527 [Paraphaeosphaeria minitans]